MYIQKVVINNIRSIEKFEMDFPNPAGWHVLIGDNGAGKSSVVRAIAAALIGPDQIAGVLPIWSEWLNDKSSAGKIELEIMPDWNVDSIGRGQPTKNKTVANRFEFKKDAKNIVTLSTNANDKKMPPTNYNWNSNAGWFSVAYGPFRRFTGGEEKRNKVFYAYPKAGAHLSVFGEEIALTEALDWLKELDRKRLKQKEQHSQNTVSDVDEIYNNESEVIFKKIQSFINTSGLLPHNTYFDSINLDGEVIFKDGNEAIVKVTQMSDGYRSILSLMFELLRQLILKYGVEKVFKKQNEIEIVSSPGVVLIDEIDAHLHPTWQTRIGQWFTKYFPNIQFIVTTHSPLVCRACENGSIWRLAAPGSGMSSGKIAETDKNILINGDVLDAYGTTIFGKGVTISVEAVKKKEKLIDLSNKKRKGTLEPGEELELNQLQLIFPVDDTIEL